MNKSAARFGGGFLALAAIWIGVYWWWEPSRSAGVSFADTAQTEAQPSQPPAGDATLDGSPGPDDDEATPPATDPPPDNPPDPQGGVTPPEFRDHTIRRGDTFESISRQYFGTTRFADAIAASNPFVSPTNLREGRVIRVPLDPDNVQGKDPEGDEPDLPEPEFIEYTVVRGDTLSEIAQHFYGSLRYADVIFNANRDTLDSMDDLRLGQVLRIPSRKSVLGEDE